MAVVSTGGPIAGTFLTLLVVPVLIHVLEPARRARDRRSMQAA